MTEVQYQKWEEIDRIMYGPLLFLGVLHSLRINQQSVSDELVKYMWKMWTLETLRARRENMQQWC